MDNRSIALLRLRNQHLVCPASGPAAALVAWLGAVQAQEYDQTKWGLGLRLTSATSASVESELNDGAIIRTHVLRPTWHFVHAKDLRWMLLLTAPRVHAKNATMYRQLDLPPKTLTKAAKLVLKYLSKIKQGTRPLLAKILADGGIKAEGHRLSYIMMFCELEAMICNGPRQGKQHTYMLLDSRVPAIRSDDRSEALHKLTRLYFQSRGPATISDFATWSGLTQADCLKGVQAHSGGLLCITCNNERYFHFEPGSDKKPGHSLHLLPVYDEMIMGYRNREAIRTDLTPNAKFRYDSMILYNGRIIGAYHRQVQPRSIDFETDYFIQADKKILGMTGNAIQKYRAFFGFTS